MNDLYLTVLPHGEAYDYRFVYSTEHPCFFDEHCGIERIMKYNNMKMYVWSMGIQNGVLADISPFSLEFGFKDQGQQLDNVYFEYENGDLMLRSKQIMIPTVYAHFAKRKFEIKTNNINHFLIVPNAYVGSNEGYPTISDIENERYTKAFSKGLRNSRIKRAFRLGIIKVY